MFVDLRFGRTEQAARVARSFKRLEMVDLRTIRVRPEDMGGLIEVLIKNGVRWDDYTLDVIRINQNQNLGVSQ